MVDFVTFLEPTQNGDRILDRGRCNEDGLETTLERRVLLDVLPVFVQRCRADHAQLASRERGLEHVASVHGALTTTGADHRVHLVEEDHIATIGFRDLLENGLEPLFELPAVLGPREHRPDVQLEQLLVGQRGRHVAFDHALSETFDDGGLPHTRLTDQHRIVLRTSGQDLDNTADLFVSSDDRIELPAPCLLSQIPRETGERTEAVLRGVIGDPMRTSH